MSNHYTRMINSRNHRDETRDLVYGHDWTPEQFEQIERGLIHAELDYERRT